MLLLLAIGSLVATTLWYNYNITRIGRFASLSVMPIPALEKPASGFLFAGHNGQAEWLPGFEWPELGFQPEEAVGEDTVLPPEWRAQCVLPISDDAEESSDCLPHYGLAGQLTTADPQLFPGSWLDETVRYALSGQDMRRNVPPFAEALADSIGSERALAMLQSQSNMPVHAATSLYGEDFVTFFEEARAVTRQRVTMPFSNTFGYGTPVVAVFSVYMDYSPNRISSNIFLRYTGCVHAMRVNEQTIKFGSHYPCAENSYVRLSNLMHYLEPGRNSIDIFITPEGLMQQLELDLYSSYSHWSLALGIFIALAFSMWAVLLLARIDWMVTTVACLSIFYWIAYYFGYGWNVIGSDIEGHISYIKYVMRYHQMPDPLRSWQSYQPPLYHFICAWLAKLWHLYIEGDPIRAAKVVSILSYFGFTVFSLMTIKDEVRGKWSQRVASLLLLFWPLGVSHNNTINNDVLGWFVGALTFWALLRWYRNRQREYLTLAVLGTALSVLTKNTGWMYVILLLGVLGYAAQPWHYRRIMKRLRWIFPPKKVAVPLIFAVVMLTVCMGANILRPALALHAGKNMPLLVGNEHKITRSQYLAWGVPNKLENYYTFDYKRFVKYPYYSMTSDNFGRPYFWNVFLKTWLFGRHSGGAWHSKTLAIELSQRLIILVGFMMLLCTFQAVSGGAVTRYRMAPHFILMIAMIAGLMAARYNIPISPSSHARYIYPITLLFVIAYGRAMTHACEKRYYIFAVFGAIVAFWFVSTSARLMWLSTDHTYRGLITYMENLYGNAVWYLTHLGSSTP